MAKSEPKSTSNAYIKYTFELTEKEKKPESGKTVVNLKIFIYRTNTGYTTSGKGTLYYWVDGVYYYHPITVDDKITNAGIYLVDKDFEIDHNADGGKTLVVKAQIDHERFTSTAQSYQQVLEPYYNSTIPTLSNSTINMGEVVTISLPRASEKYTHKLKYAVGSTTVDIEGEHSTSYEWEIPISLARNTPNSDKITIAIDCYTYSGTTLIGNRQRVFLTAIVPPNIIPEIKSFDIVTNHTNPIIDDWGVNVQGFTDVTLVCEAEGVYDSKISTYAFSGGYSETNIHGVCKGDISSKSGNISFSVVATDSRGHSSNVESREIFISPYQSPMVTDFFVERSTSNSAKIQAKVSYVYSSVDNKNTAVARLYYKTGKGGWNEYGIIDNDVLTELDGVFSESLSYDFRVVVIDTLSSQTHAEIPVSTAKVLLDFRAGGNGLGIGRVAETDALEVAFESKFFEKTNFDKEVYFNVPIYIDNMLLDYIVDKGEKNGWHYEKWLSGKYRCWCIRDFGNVAITGANGNVYIGNTGVELDYPDILSSIDKIQVTPATTGFTFFSFGSEVTTSKIPLMVLMRPTSATVNVKLSIEIEGILLTEDIEEIFEEGIQEEV